MPPSPRPVLKEYLLCLGRLQRLQGRALEEALSAWRQGDPQARRRLHEDHLADVLRWVLPYRSKLNRFQQLIEAGNRGLAKALQDPRAALAPDFSAWLQSQVLAEVESFLAAAKPRS